MAIYETLTKPEMLELSQIIAKNMFLAVGFLCFTVRQREHIKRRDNFICQHPECRDRKNARLEVHHVIPQGYAKAVGIDPDFETNGITLCRTCHSRVHPDRLQALSTYKRDRNSFGKLRIDRDALIKQRQVYWETIWDRQFLATAVRNTQKFARENPHVKFPDKREVVQREEI